MSGSQTLLFVIVGRNEPLYEAEFQKRGSTAPTSDAATRQNYFVLHSSLDLVEKAAWNTTNMNLKVVDKVRVCSFKETKSTKVETRTSHLWSFGYADILCVCVFRSINNKFQPS